MIPAKTSVQWCRYWLQKAACLECFSIILSFFLFFAIPTGIRDSEFLRHHIGESLSFLTDKKLLVIFIIGSQLIVVGYLTYYFLRYGDAVRLAVAVKAQDRAEVERLLSTGVPPSAADGDGITALHLCQDEMLAELLLAKGADPNARQKESLCTPLHCTNSLAMATVFLAKGADPNATSKESRTLLCHHYRQGNKDMVRLLAKHGANINAPALACGTLLHIAQTIGQADELIAMGADPNVPAPDLKTRTDLGAYYSERCRCRGIFLGLKVSDEYGTLDYPCEGGGTPLHYAVIRNKEGLIPFLLDKGASVSVQDICGGTPLHYVQTGNFAKLLLEKGADPNARMVLGLTPLHMAVLFLRIDVVKELLAGGADPNALTEPLMKKTITDFEGSPHGNHTITYSYVRSYVRFLPIIFATVNPEIINALFAAFRYPIPFDLSEPFPVEPKYVKIPVEETRHDLFPEEFPEDKFSFEEKWKQIRAKGEIINGLLVQAGSIPFCPQDWAGWQK